MSRSKPRSGYRRPAGLVGCAVLLAAVAFTACGDDIAGSGNAPADHTINQSGAMHRPGLNDPVVNCTACHGADLMGGLSGQPSCFTCHGKRWN
ncbi:MAG: hypothetical protein OEO20_10805 [Gemmatimonadota bacterium]|nr:hypothetical protein [Gemmatimonadota bacterium]MDH3368256.1 hypothetical protein [Gemmatimonadota bacterium]MDH3478781.1 hypothetical protein [Gemmatimonadota bacterium]MDH3568844.1 hypothetical protein [Gemmatimonadota bacterium]MDH5550831.1 hypothetical protein [Gemmatimonadota bacterium]